MKNNNQTKQNSEISKQNIALSEISETKIKFKKTIKQIKLSGF